MCLIYFFPYLCTGLSIAFRSKLPTETFLLIAPVVKSLLEASLTREIDYQSYALTLYDHSRPPNSMDLHDFAKVISKHFEDAEVVTKDEVCDHVETIIIDDIISSDSVIDHHNASDLQGFGI